MMMCVWVLLSVLVLSRFFDDLGCLVQINDSKNDEESTRPQLHLVIEFVAQCKSNKVILFGLSMCLKL